MLRSGWTVLLVVLGSLMIAINWGALILAIQVGKVAESSLGYFIFPLVAVLLGWLIHASRRLPLASVGLLQYINPSLQFLCAVVILGETVTVWHMIAFPMIWAALVLYSAEALRRERASRLPPISPAS